MPAKEGDIVADIVARIDAALGAWLKNELGFEQEFVDQISRQIRAQERPVRQKWQGTRPYVPSLPLRDEDKTKAIQEVRRTGNVAGAAGSTGLSVATIYRMMKGKR